MRLSEDRINAIAHKIAFELVKKRAVVTTKRLAQVEAWVEKPMLEDLQLEDTIDQEVRKHLARMSNCPPEGSFQYQAMFLKKKEEIARRHNYDF